MAAGASHSLALADDGTLLVWGAGTSAQLGLQTEVQMVPVRPTVGVGKIAHMDAGNAHSVALNDDGSVIYQLGRKFIQPQIRDKALRFVAVCAGSWHSMALTTDGFVYTWGQNEYGQLGHGRIGPGEHKPTRIALQPQDAHVRFVGIAAGARHSFALADDGRLWSWGAGEFAQLGHGDLEQRLHPKRIEDPRTVRFVQVDGGTWHSVALSSTGEVYTWGGGGYGQLGHVAPDALETLVYRPTRVSFTDSGKIVKVAAGENFTAALSKDGRLWTWGSNNAGQLGYETKKERFGRCALAPRLVPVPPHVQFIDVSAGAAHTLAVRAVRNWLGVALGTLLDGRFADTPLALAGHAPLRLHACVLSVRVPRLLRAPLPDLHGMSNAVLQHVLSYVYTDELPAISDPAEWSSLAECAALLELSALAEWAREGLNAFVSGRRIAVPIKHLPLASAMHSLLVEGRLTDFSLVPQTGAPVRCHQAVLAVRLDYFAALFRTQMSEAATATSTLPLSEECVRVLLSYVYTGECDEVQAEHALPLLVHVGYLTLTGAPHAKLRHHCGRLVCAGLTVDNCLDVLQSVRGDEVPDVQARIVAYVVEHYDNVACRHMAAFARLPPPLFQLVQIALNLTLLRNEARS